MPHASVIIATHNRANELRACLAALSRQRARGTFEVVVVDNGSHDETPSVLAAAESASVRHVYEAQPNRARARNAGIEAARGELIIFCDDDTVAPEGFVAAHVAAHAAAPNSVVSGPIINVRDETHLIEPSHRHYSRAFFCTCNVSVNRAALLAVGGFDEQYNLYGWEDTDLGIRLRAKGLRRLFAWPAFLYHVKPLQSHALERRRALATEKGTMAARFVRKTPSWPVKLATGAYGANFVRAAVFAMAPMRRLCERLANGARPGSLLAAWATETLVDAAYVDALKSALRQPRC